MYMLLGMDTEALISAVYVRRPVWDKKHKLHCNRSVIERCWRDISAEMAENEFKLRKRWKYLRDQFAIELGKALASCSETSGNNVISKWPYFNLLSFLRDVVKPRLVVRAANSSDGIYDTTENLESPVKSPETILGYSVDADASSSLQEVEYQEYTLTEENVDDPDASEFVTVATKKRKHGDVDPFACSTPKFVEEVLGRKEDHGDDNDEHLCFFKSLIPHIKKIPRTQLLSFRSRINELVEFYAYEEFHETSNLHVNSDSNLSIENSPSTSKRLRQ